MVNSKVVVVACTGIVDTPLVEMEVSNVEGIERNTGAMRLGAWERRHDDLCQTLDKLVLFALLILFSATTKPHSVCRQLTRVCIRLGKLGKYSMCLITPRLSKLEASSTGLECMIPQIARPGSHIACNKGLSDY